MSLVLLFFTYGVEVLSTNLAATTSSWLPQREDRLTDRKSEPEFHTVYTCPSLFKWSKAGTLHECRVFPVFMHPWLISDPTGLFSDL